MIGRILLAVAALALLRQAHGAEPVAGRLASIEVPGKPLDSFDFSWVDPVTQTYYLADRANAAVDIVDAGTGVFLGRIEGFAGRDPDPEPRNMGPNGIVTTLNHELWATDARGAVRVADLRSRKIIATIETGGHFRADSVSYDPLDNIVLVAGDHEDPPLLTLISADPADRRIIASVPVPDATDGLETAVWDPESGLFFAVVPELGHDAQAGGVIGLEPATGHIVRHLAVPRCKPTGIARGPSGRLLLGCSTAALTAGYEPRAVSLDPQTGTIVDVGRIGGVDQVWFNPGDRRFYLAAGGDAAGPVLAVVDAVADEPVQAWPTRRGAHSVAVDPIGNRAFVPLPPDPADPACTHGCIAVFGSTALPR